MFDRSFDRSQLDGLTQGLRHHYRRVATGTPAALRRLRRARVTYARMFDEHDVLLSPVLAQVSPPLGHVSPTVPFDTLIARLQDLVVYTPLQNVAGTPAISLPMALTEEGVPIGIQLATAHGDERTLLELAFALEDQISWPRIQDQGA